MASSQHFRSQHTCFRFLLKMEISGHKQFCKWAVVVLAILSVAAGGISRHFDAIA